jgi:dsDNA-specific endonuclease/ATPase MutS2
VGTEEDDPVEVPIGDEIDLHSFRPAETASVVEEYLREAFARGLREVRIVHGRGIGAQRRTVRAVLGRSPLVEEFRDAPPEGGGWGATVARLRPGGAGTER